MCNWSLRRREEQNKNDLKSEAVHMFHYVFNDLSFD